MGFEPANIWQDFKQASETTQGTIDDNSNQVLLGPRLNEAVRHFANGYLEKLELGPADKATSERAKLLDLQWGRIEHDGAMLRGLGAALSNFAEVLGANVTRLGESWQGESYDAFKAAMAKVQGTIAAYGTYATATGDGLVNSMSQLRTVFEQFAQDSANTHLHFGDVSPPEYWHKIGTGDYTPDALADGCPTWFAVGNCTKNDEEQSSVINGRFVTQRRWDICMADPCEDNAGRVLIMYRNMVDACHDAREGIRSKLHNFFAAVGATVETVSNLYDAALGNVYTLANAEVFSSLRVIGAGGGGQPGDGGDTGAPAGYPGDTGGGYPGSGGPGPAAVAEPMPPTPEPSVEDTAPAEAPPDTAAPEPDTAADQPATVEIKDGDRTIGVTSPDGEGRVRVTVDDGTGKTTTYELDFDAASGLLPPRPADSEPGAEAADDAPKQVPARTDGKCVIQDGPLTITAERPLFSPESIQLTVDDGTGNPTSYTLDFDEEPGAETPSGAAATEAGKQEAQAPGSAPRPGADQAAAVPAEPAPAEDAVPDGTGAEPETPAAASQDPVRSADTDAESAPGAALRDPVRAEAAAEPASAAAPQDAVLRADADAESASAAAPEDAVRSADAGLAPAASPQDPVRSADTDAEPAPAAAAPAVEDEPAGTSTQRAVASQTQAAASDVASQPGWLADRESMSGVLVPDQPEGEAGLAKAPDAAEPDTSGMVGSGMPVMGGGAPPSGGSEPGRVGSGWSVHGDLFDSAEPVYSMHGVLGDDDQATE
ncbi:DNA polymerase III subunit gamma/tau domain-containing protein [Actinophytocola sp. KF-1]